MSFIDMYFRFPNGFEFRVPVIPPEINVNDGATWHRVEVVGLGEVAQPAFRRPQEITFSSFFPYHYDPGYCQYSNLMHPADAQNLFNVAMGTRETRPQLVRFIMVEEYEQGVWTTWLNDDFAIETFQKQHRAGDLVDIHYTITLRAVRQATLRATGALADNIGSEKPHPARNRSGEEDNEQENYTGATPARISRPRISPTNAQLQSGIDISNVSPKLAAGAYYVDLTSPVGGSKYSSVSPEAHLWGNDSSAEVLMSPYDAENALGTYLTPINYSPEQITRDEYVNNGGTVIIGGGGGGGNLAP